jgi:DNA-binding CsgD family transcriptional regulator
MMRSRVKASGILYGAVFFLGAMLNVATTLVRGDASLLGALLNFQWVDSLLLISAVMFVSAYVGRLAWLQPAVMLALMPLPILSDSDSFYGLGFFAVGVLLLFRLGFYDRMRALKIACSIGYLLVAEVVSVLRKKEEILASLGPVFFIVVFIGFLLLTFRDTIFVYLKEPKPTLSLGEKGLSDAERVYVLAILKGKAVKEASLESGVSESTVRNTLARAYKKLGIANRSNLMALAKEFDVVK